MQGDRTTRFSDAEEYDRLMGRHSRLLAPLFRRFFGSINDGDNVLDVGCGTGSLTFTIFNTTKTSKTTFLHSASPQDIGNAHTQKAHFCEIVLKNWTLCDSPS